MPYARTANVYRRPKLGHHQRHTCTCGALLVGIRMIRKGGRRGGVMPCHDEIIRGDGSKNLVILDDFGFGHLVVRAPASIWGREVHWGNCRDHEHYAKA